MEGASTDQDDPFAALAQIKARRAMADLAGFPHDPSWDQQEREALARLRTGAPAAEPDESPAPGPISDDPLADLAKVAALRFAADSMGMRHDPAWDREEADVARQMRSDVDPEVDPPMPS